jgi:hypothetical protein
MSDFKFNCPKCGQHLSADVSYAGKQVACPACGQQVVAPGAPATAAPPAIRISPPSASPPRLPRLPTGARPPQKTCGLAIASLICSIGSFLIIPLGFIPGIICGHLARKKIAGTPGLQGGGLAKAGLIVGYVALGLNVLAVAALVAFFAFFATQVRQARSVAQPPFPRSAMRPPPNVAPPRMMQPDTAQPPEPETTDTEPDGSGWTMKLAGVETPSSVVAGRIHGQPFEMEKAVLEGGWLKLVQGKHFIADREIDVVTFENDISRLSGRTFTVPKQEFGGNPHIWMKWKELGVSMPKQKAYMDHYVMRLEFGAPSGGKLPGKIYLCLPDLEKSFIAGTFEAQLKGSQ